MSLSYCGVLYYIKIHQLLIVFNFLLPILQGLQGEEDVDSILLGNFTYSANESPLQSFPVHVRKLFMFLPL